MQEIPGDTSSGRGLISVSEFRGLIEQERAHAILIEWELQAHSSGCLSVVKHLPG